MTTSPDAARLRAALSDHLESVMSVTDTERELSRFRQSVSQRRGRRRVLAVAASVLVLAGAGGTYLVVRDGDATLPATTEGSGEGLSGAGTLTVRGAEGSPSDVSRQDEYRGASIAGPVTLSTADGERTEELSLTSSAGAVNGPDGVTLVFHGWGEASMTLDGAICRGSWALSHYEGSPDGGGSVHMSCDDGTVLGASLAADRLAQQDLTDLWQLDLRLEDGFLLEG